MYTDILEDMTKNQNVLDLAHSDSHFIHTSKSSTFNKLWIPKPNPENVTRAEAYDNVSPHDNTAYFWSNACLLSSNTPNHSDWGLKIICQYWYN